MMKGAKSSPSSLKPPERSRKKPSVSKSETVSFAKGLKLRAIDSAVDNEVIVDFEKNEAIEVPPSTSGGTARASKASQGSPSKSTTSKKVSQNRRMTHQKSVTTDAKPINSRVESIGGSTVPRVRMSVSAGSMEYNMTHARRGKAVIFNHEIFDDENLPRREGTKKDEARLQNTLKMLEFEVEVCSDFTRFDIEVKIKELAKENHDDCDCLFVAVLTHGDKDFLHARDRMYATDEIWRPFGADKCPTLAGKPKIFIIQACRGIGRDKGVIMEQVSYVQTDSVVCSSYKIPSMTDFVIGNASFDGFVSFRDGKGGSWYIQSLCEVLENHQGDMDLLKMLTRAGHKVAVEFTAESDNPSDNDAKQAPTVLSTLIRDVVFTPKKKGM